MTDEPEDAYVVQYPDGPIEAGMVFLWEPHQPRVMCLLEVIETKTDSDDEAWVKARTLMAHPCHVGVPLLDETWNPESRFREACALVQIRTVANSPEHLIPAEDR